MTKEEKIKEDWGVYFEHFGEHAVKHALENNGFCSVPLVTLGLILRRHGEEWLEVNEHIKYRPKSLQGIENNNGWIKIESESDLPIDKGYYDFQNFPHDVYRINPVFWDPTSTKIGWFIETYTHYRPIEKPKPPIY